MVPKKIFIALQAHSISCHSAMGHLSTLWQLLRDGDRRLQYCLTAGGGRGWGQSPSFFWEFVASYSEKHSRTSWLLMLHR